MRLETILTAVAFCVVIGAAVVAALDRLTSLGTAPVTGPITGKVVTEDGTPLSGATVRVWIPETASRPRRAAWTGPTVRECVTGADGSFVLTDLRNAQYWIGAWAEGWAIGPGGDRRDCLVRPGESCELAARKVVRVPVTVLLPDGTRVRDRVGFSWADSTGPRGGVSGPDADDTIQVPPGTWIVSAGPYDERLACEPVRVEAAWNAPCAPVTFRLKPK